MQSHDPQFCDVIPGSAEEHPLVKDVLGHIWHHPYQALVLGWNWKSAVVSACYRAPVFFLVSLEQGIMLALHGAANDALFNALGAGVYGAFLQSIRKARPAWLASWLGAFAVPLVIQSLLFAYHRITGTSSLHRGIVVSLVMSGISAMFNMYAMRRGNMLVGKGSPSLWDDLRQLPRIILDFLMSGPRQCARWLKVDAQKSAF